MIASRSGSASPNAIAESTPFVLGSADTRRSIEEAILTATVGAIDPQDAAQAEPNVSHERIVERAEAALRHKDDAAIYVADLCQAAGVSERTLRNAFQSIYGVSPIRFLNARRLHQVRRALRREPNAGVTEVAVRYGVGNVGRFAVEYRQLFGESPSQTRRGAAR